MPKDTAHIDAFLAGSNLNDYQKAFCKDPQKNIRLLAPAGNGKTHSLLWRCVTQKRLAGEESQRFLIFTFTRAARDELLRRLVTEPAFAEIRDLVEIATLNAWGYRRLRSRLSNPRLLTDKKDIYWTMQNNLQGIWMNYPRIAAQLSNSKSRNAASRDLMEVMDLFKTFGYRHDRQETKQDFLNHTAWLDQSRIQKNFDAVLEKLRAHKIIDEDAVGEKMYEQVYKHFFQFWRKAVKALHASALITLEDQKYLTWIDIEKAVSEGKFSSGIHRVHHILVDEFQDINILDLELLRVVAASNKTSLCIVGDDDQAIYEWRGATPEFLIDPNEHIEENYSSHVLGVNYRSPKNIVDLSQKLIKHNKWRVPKDIKADRKDTAEIVVERCATVEESIEYVSETVQAFLEDKSIKKIALISRKKSQIIPYQIIFAAERIPFCAAEDLQIFLSGAFKDLLELVAYKTQADVPPPRGPEPIQVLLRLVDKVKKYPLSKADREALKYFLTIKRPRTVLQALDYLFEYTGKVKNISSESFYDAVLPFFEAETVADTIRALSDNFIGLQKDYGKSLDDIFYADPPFLYLAEYAERYEDDFDTFYEDIESAMSTLASVPSNDDQNVNNVWQERLHLMTALRAKGKEFDAVIILDCNDDIFPIKFADTVEKIEAERRLFYVAFTRAKKKIHLIVNNEMFGKPVRPSPFIGEMGLT